ncbi:MAG: hypothetical protein RI996_453 [Candidatus Parcubacteria bacterium]|jgi:hypothetical protein
MVHSLSPQEVILLWKSELDKRAESRSPNNSPITCPEDIENILAGSSCDFPEMRARLGVTDCTGRGVCPVREAYIEARRALGIVSEFYHA